jgi:hypothetical protein
MGSPPSSNELIPGDHMLYEYGHNEMQPITREQYCNIFEALFIGVDPSALIKETLCQRRIKHD